MRPELRVVSVDHCARLSGGEIALARVAPLLKGFGIDLSVILGDEGPLRERLAGIPVEVIPAIRLDGRDGGGAGYLRGYRLVPGVMDLARHLRDLSPDVVHCNSMQAGLVGSVAARLAGIPCVWHLRDFLGPDGRLGFAGRLLKAFAGRAATLVVANSASTAASAGLAGRSLVVYDGTSLPGVRAAAYRGGALKIIMAGRLAEWKGQDVAIEAVRQVRRASIDVTLTLAGAALFEADLEFERQVKADAADAVRQGWIQFVGFVSDPYESYLRHHVAVHCSRLPEPFGQVIVEAMSCGLPVVASAAGGPEEIMTGGLTDLLATPGDPVALGDRLARLADPVWWKVMSDASLERAPAFSIERTAEGLANAFRLAHEHGHQRRAVAQ